MSTDSELHRLTYDANNSLDLWDITRLVHYCREHDIEYSLSDCPEKRLDEEGKPWVAMKVYSNALPIASSGVFYIYEDADIVWHGAKRDNFIYIGPDGAIYDEDRRRL